MQGEGSIPTRDRGPSGLVRNVCELFIGQEALVIRGGDGAITTIPLRTELQSTTAFMDSNEAEDSGIRLILPKEIHEQLDLTQT